MLILNRDFTMPSDGWYQLAPLGEFAHANAGVIQVIDEEACVAMAARFAADAAVANFPGLLVDFDHFSLNGETRSEAAGWIVGMEYRGPRAEGGILKTEAEKIAAGDSASHIENGKGLWAQIRWSDLGEAAVKGGRYRFLSPVWARTDCVDLGGGRVRPVRLLNAAVTNDPNLRGMRPLSNSSQESSTFAEATADKGGRRQNEDRGVENLLSDRGACNADKGERVMKAVIEKLVNHLGLAADATEAVILEKMAGMPPLTAVTELQNSLSAARTELDGVKASLKAVEGELVNRHLEEFEGVVTEKTKEFWTEQLMVNRQAALTALADLAEGRATGTEEPTPTPSKEGNQTRKPLHNRATARPVIPGSGAATGEAESKAVKIRNRAQEIVKSEKVPFSVAFRRAEKEVCGG